MICTNKLLKDINEISYKLHMFVSYKIHFFKPLQICYLYKEVALLSRSLLLIKEVVHIFNYAIFVIKIK